MKNKYISSLILGALLSFGANAQQNQFEWAVSTGGTTNADSGKAVTTDPSGNVYTTGKFSGTVDFDPGVGTTTLTSSGGGDVFLQKLDANGLFVWVKQFGGSTGADQGLALAADASAVYLGGIFKNATDFDPGAGTTTLTPPSSSTEGFILKLNSNGDFVWANQFGGAGNDQPSQIKLDGLGNLYFVGYYNGTGTFGGTTLVSQGAENGMITKMDTTGNFVWTQNIESTSSVRVQGVDIDAAGNPVIVGWYDGTIDLDPGVAVVNATTAGDRDIFYLKLDASGNYDWSHSLGSTGLDQGKAVTIDANGNIIFAGQFSLVVDFDPGAGNTDLTSNGTNDACVHKFDSSGNFIWAKSFGSTAGDFAQNVMTTPSGSIYVSGVFGGSTDFDPGVGTQTLTTAGSQDIFLLGLDPSGVFINVETYGSTGNDQAYGTHADANGMIYLTGQFENTVDFDYSSGVADLTSLGAKDIFTLKLEAACGLQIGSTEIVEECASYTWATNDSTYTTSGMYYATLVASNSCDSLVTLDLTIHLLDLTLLQGANSLTSNMSGADYQWIDCDSNTIVTGETGQIFFPSTIGNYAVIVTTVNCSDTSECILFDNTGLTTIDKMSEVVVYPNPVIDILTISNENLELITISVLDQSGRVVAHITSNDSISTIDMQSMTSGIYFVKVESADAIKTIKIAKK